MAFPKFLVSYFWHVATLHPIFLTFLILIVTMPTFHLIEIQNTYTLNAKVATFYKLCKLGKNTQSHATNRSSCHLTYVYTFFSYTKAGRKSLNKQVICQVSETMMRQPAAADAMAEEEAPHNAIANTRLRSANKRLCACNCHKALTLRDVFVAFHCCCSDILHLQHIQFIRWLSFNYNTHVHMYVFKHVA